MKKKIVILALIVGLMILLKLWVGVYEHDEFGHKGLFFKHRPIWKSYFYSPRGMSDLTLDEMTPKLQKEQLLFDEFILNMKFSSRIHTSELETDWYRLLGTTNLIKHQADFDAIDWKEAYWRAFESGTFNMPDLEVLNKKDQRYLSITTTPNTPETFQFVIGLGSHQETANDSPIRRVQLYFTESEDPSIPKYFIELFFNRSYSKITDELKKYDMEEMEDTYQNIDE